MRKNPAPEEFYATANGHLAERFSVSDGPDIILHYAEIPESDVMTVNGIRITKPLRTIIDIATTTPSAQWEEMIRVCLTRQLFTNAEALERIAQPDMAKHPGAMVLGQFLADTETRT